MAAKVISRPASLYDEDHLDDDDQAVPVHQRSAKKHNSKHSVVPDVLRSEYDAWLHSQSDSELYTLRHTERLASSSFSDDEYIAAGSIAPDALTDKSRAYAKRRNDYLHRKGAARLQRVVVADEEVFLASLHARGDRGRDAEFVRQKQEQKALRGKGRNGGRASEKFRAEETDWTLSIRLFS